MFDFRWQTIKMIPVCGVLRFSSENFFLPLTSTCTVDLNGFDGLTSNWNPVPVSLAWQNNYISHQWKTGGKTHKTGCATSMNDVSI